MDDRGIAIRAETNLEQNRLDRGGSARPCQMRARFHDYFATASEFPESGTKA